MLAVKQAFGQFFQRHLFFVNTSVSSSLQGIGDLLQQSVERRWRNDPEAKHDWRRTRRMMTIGFVLGALNHRWYKFLDQRFKPKTRRSLVRKVLLDQTVAAPVIAFTFIAGLSAMEGKGPKGALKEFAAKFPTVYAADCSIWPGIQFVNFYFMPPHFRTIYVSSMDFLWYRFNSYVKHKD